MSTELLMAHGVKSGPPVLVSGLTLAGLELNDWVLIATLVWIVLQIGWFVWSKMVRPSRQEQDPD